MEITKIEAILRLCALLTLFMAAIVLYTDNASKTFFGAYKMKVNYKLALIFKILMYSYSIGAVYNLFQLIRCLAVRNYEGDKLSWSNHILKWIYFLLDQVAAYSIFAILCASIQMSFLAITGNKELEWMKLCSKFARFCVQVGGSIACGSVASLLLAVISGISTFNLFRWYSSPNFLCLKSKKIGVVRSLSD